MAATSQPAPPNAPYVLEVFNQHVWVLHNITDQIAEELAALPGVHGRERFGPLSYHIDVDTKVEGEWLKTNAIVASRLRDLGFGFFNQKEMSPVGHVKYLRKAGLVTGEFLETYRSRADADRLRPF